MPEIKILLQINLMGSEQFFFFFHNILKHKNKNKVRIIFYF